MSCDVAAEQAVERAERDGIDHLRALATDSGGITRVKLVTRQHLAGAIQHGIGLSSSFALINAADMLESTPHFSLAVGEVKLMPDPAMIVTLPYAPGAAAAPVDMVNLDGTPFEACPRTFLKRQVARLAERGFEPIVGHESEFFFYEPLPDGGAQPPYSAPFYGSAALHVVGPVLTEIIEALDEQGIDVAQYHPEAGQGQCELSIEVGDPVLVADQQVFIRETVKSIAIQNGLRATFCPKPYLMDIGSGAHLHVSFWRDGANAFYDPNGQFDLSDTALSYIAGVLEHLPALSALTCPSVNSYTRLQPGAWSSSTVSWGFLNREASVRTYHGPPGTEAQTTNVELKAIDATCNPYLAMGALLAAGLDGIERGLTPIEPIDVAPGSLSAEEQRARGIVPLPASLEEALDNLERDEVLLSALGEAHAEAYLKAKRNEVLFFADKDKEFELSFYRTRF